MPVAKAAVSAMPVMPVMPVMSVMSVMPVMPVMAAVSAAGRGLGDEGNQSQGDAAGEEKSLDQVHDDCPFSRLRFGLQ